MLLRPEPLRHAPYADGPPDFAIGLKPQTVAGYVKVIYQKLHVTSRAEAVLAAAQRGLT